MGISKRGRRTTEYKNRCYVWWVGRNEDSCDEVELNIISEDKSIVLSYKVGDGRSYIVSKGRIFQGKKTSGCWEVYSIPMKEPLMVVTPKIVSEIIAWAVDGRGAIPLNKA